jgi:hypothetical protein
MNATAADAAIVCDGRENSSGIRAWSHTAPTVTHNSTSATKVCPALGHMIEQLEQAFVSNFGVYNF